MSRCRELAQRCARDLARYAHPPMAPKPFSAADEVAEKPSGAGRPARKLGPPDAAPQRSAPPSSAPLRDYRQSRARGCEVSTSEPRARRRSLRNPSSLKSLVHHGYVWGGSCLLPHACPQSGKAPSDIHIPSMRPVPGGHEYPPFVGLRSFSHEGSSSVCGSIARDSAISALGPIRLALGPLWRGLGPPPPCVRLAGCVRLTI